MTEPTERSTMVARIGRISMATSLVDDARAEDWSEPRYVGAIQRWTRGEMLWTLFGLVLLLLLVFSAVAD
jgi:hypothetical protein